MILPRDREEWPDKPLYLVIEDGRNYEVERLFRVLQRFDAFMVSSYRDRVRLTGVFFNRTHVEFQKRVDECFDRSMSIGSVRRLVSSIGRDMCSELKMDLERYGLSGRTFGSQGMCRSDSGFSSCMEENLSNVAKIEEFVESDDSLDRLLDDMSVLIEEDS